MKTNAQSARLITAQRCAVAGRQIRANTLKTSHATPLRPFLRGDDELGQDDIFHLQVSSRHVSMNIFINDDKCCEFLIEAFAKIFPSLTIKSGAPEPFYQAAKPSSKAVLHFRSNYPRSLLHEISHYCLAGEARRKVDDFGYWYSPCGRSEAEQAKFEAVEARPQGLEKALCEIVGLAFSPSLDDFSGRPPSQFFLWELDKSYREMLSDPPPTAHKALAGLQDYLTTINPALK